MRDLSRRLTAIIAGLQLRNANDTRFVKSSGCRRLGCKCNAGQELEVFDSLIRTTNARRRGFRLLVHPTYEAVKLPKINKETNLWQFRSTTAAKRRDGKRARGRECEVARRTFVREVLAILKKAKVDYRVSQDCLDS